MRIRLFTLPRTMKKLDVSRRPHPPDCLHAPNLPQPWRRCGTAKKSIEVTSEQREDLEAKAASNPGKGMHERFEGCCPSEETSQISRARLSRRRPTSAPRLTIHFRAPPASRRFEVSPLLDFWRWRISTDRYQGLRFHRSHHHHHHLDLHHPIRPIPDLHRLFLPNTTSQHSRSLASTSVTA